MAASYFKNAATTLIEEKEPRSSWDERAGWLTTRIFKGRHKEVRDAQVAYAGAGVVAARVNPVDEIWAELEVDFRSQIDGSGNPVGNPNDQVQTTWDLKPTIYANDAWLAPVIKDELAKIGPEEDELRNEILRRMRFLMDALLRGDQSAPAVYFLNQSIPPDADLTDVVPLSLNKYISWIQTLPGPQNLVVWRRFCGELAHGATSYNVNSWVLSKHQIAPSAATVKTSDLNINRWYTLSALLAEEPTITTIARITMPTDGFWWKQPPTLLNQPNGTYVMEQEWAWAPTYSKLYYKDPIV